MAIPFLSEKGIGFTCGDKTSENWGYFFEELFTSESVFLQVAQVPLPLQCLQYLQFVQELQYESLPLHLPA